MKTILSIFFFCLFFAIEGYGQIRISGIENVKTKTNNSDATFIRKEVEVTKTTKDGTATTGVIKNKIEESKTYETPNGVGVELESQTTVVSDSSKQVIIDLNEAKYAAQPNGLSSKEGPGSTTLDKGPKVQLEKDQYFTVFSPEGMVLYTSKPGSIPTAVTTTRTVIEEKPDIQKTTNTWAMGLNVGSTILQGDVRSKMGFGFGISLQKAISRRFSLRYQSTFMQAYGQDWKLRETNSQFINYKTRISDHSLQAVIGLNARTPKKVLFNFIAGAGFSTFHSWRNFRDLNGAIYDYSGVSTPVTRGDRGAILGAIKEIQDNTYETVVPTNQLKAHINNTQITPSLMAGLGMTVKITKRTDFTVEHRISWHNSDGMDNYDTGGNDLLHYTSVGVNFKLGKNEMAAWWDPKKKVQITTYNTGVISKSETGVAQNIPEDKTKTKSTEKPYKEQNVIGFVFFDVNSSKVKQEYYSELYKLEKFLEDNPDFDIIIVGHGDMTATEFDNKTIAKDRAQSVYHFLTGIFKMDPERFETYYEVPKGNVVFARNQSEKNKSVTIIIK